MEQVFKSLLRSKERPTVSTFNSRIKARLREKADLVFQKITDMDMHQTSSQSEKMVKVSTLNVMLNVYYLNGLPMEADRLFETSCNSEMFHVDSSTYKLLYKSYTKANMKELLQKLMKYMDRDGIVPNKRFFLDALGALGSTDQDSVPTKVDLRIPADISKA
ncbi:hypothetical protein L6452_07965 [Arctium lappa]|uniref:Uncharacterized protein n=1 Tax=Arctium lappa TaxID=4217 RepID=A0ACB9DGF4_ARCLA|nr:hypothetical protein L6452_07965 [Arctium lappa]